MILKNFQKTSKNGNGQRALILAYIMRMYSSVFGLQRGKNSPISSILFMPESANEGKPEEVEKH